MRFAVAASVAAFLLTACATTETASSGDTGDVYDPWEGWNRRVFAFNEVVDRSAVEPVARAYRAVTPGFFRDGVNNVLTNLRQPVVFANTVLQGNPDASATTFGRFVINSTVGVVGIFDVASGLGVEKHEEDFGQTLGVWGVEPGPFLVLPVLGPSNLRDALGFGVDNAFDPINYAEFDEPITDTEFRIGRAVVGAVATRERLIGTFETLRSQPEPYIAMRRTYSSQRKAAIRNGEIEEDRYKDLPDFDDFGGFEDEEAGSAQSQE